MSRAKIERRKRRRRLAAEQSRQANEAELDITHEDEISEPKRRFRRSAPESPEPTVQAPTKAKTRVADEADGPDESSQPPPLSLSLGALLSVAFAANLLLGGIGQFDRRPVFGVVVVILGALFAVDAYFIYKRRRWAWWIMVVALGFVTATFVAGAIVQTAPGWLLGMVFTVAPMLLLLLPGSRDVLE